MTKKHEFTFKGHAHKVTASTTVVTYANRVYAEPGDYIFEFDGEDLAFVCSEDQYDRLFKPKHKPKTAAQKEAAKDKREEKAAAKKAEDEQPDYPPVYHSPKDTTKVTEFKSYKK